MRPSLDKWKRIEEKNAQRMHRTMLHSIKKAGGNPAHFSWAKMSEMTAQDLMMNLGPNRIRFVYRQRRNIIKGEFHEKEI